MSIWRTLSDAVAHLGETFSGLFAQAPERTAGFTLALVGLCAKLSRADGVVTRDELQAIRTFLTIRDEDVPHYDRLFRLASDDALSYEDFAQSIAAKFAPRDSKLEQIVIGLITIALSDGLDPREARMIADVSARFGFDPDHFAHFVALSGHSPDRDPYLVLNAPRNADMAQLEKARRALVLRHHPDRLIGAGAPEELRAAAERRLAEINAAYDEIKRRKARDGGA